jgi:glycosyltransferase involved in cell wall biosynthesis
LDKRLCWIWRRRENRLIGRFNVLVVCSEEDRKYLGNSTRIHVVPNGFDVPETVSLDEHTTPVRLGFIGLFHYKPNEEGVKWFIEEVWPSIRREVPEATLRLIGSGSEAFARSEHGIEGLGWVADPGPEIATWAAMVVPILRGGGTRIKIAEAFARRCAVVATSTGAYGYDVVAGRELLRADSPPAFASACVSLLRDSELRERLSANAFVKFQQSWTWDAIGSRVAAAVHACVNGGCR